MTQQYGHGPRKRIKSSLEGRRCKNLDNGKIGHITDVWLEQDGKGGTTTIVTINYEEGGFTQDKPMEEVESLD